MSPRRALVAAAAAALALGAVSTVAAHGDGHDDDVEVGISRLVNGRCGPPEDSLPGLIARTGIRPGEIAGDVTVCVANTGDGDAVLSLRASDLVDVDPACTGGETAGDPTCGGWRRGELAPSLLQQAGVGPCPGPPGTSTALDRRLNALQAGPLVLLDRLRQRQLVCVRLRLLYDPPDPAAAAASQSDRVFWRYAFSVAKRR